CDERDSGTQRKRRSDERKTTPERCGMQESDGVSPVWNFHYAVSGTLRATRLGQISSRCYLSGGKGAGPSSVRAGWNGIGPAQAPEIFGIEEFQADAEGTGLARAAPSHASAGATAGVETFDEEPIVRPDEVLAFQHGAEAADQKRLRFFLPGPAGSFAEQAHGMGGGEARAAPEAGFQFQGGMADVEQASTLEGILREGRAGEGIGLLDARGQERAHLVRQLRRNGALAELLGAGVQALVAGGHEVQLAIGLTFESGGGESSQPGHLQRGASFPSPWSSDESSPRERRAKPATRKASRSVSLRPRLLPICIAEASGRSGARGASDVRDLGPRTRKKRRFPASLAT